MRANRQANWSHNMKIIVHQYIVTRIILYQLIVTRILLYQLIVTRIILYQLIVTRILLYQLIATRIKFYQWLLAIIHENISKLFNGHQLVKGPTNHLFINYLSETFICLSTIYQRRSSVYQLSIRNVDQWKKGSYCFRVQPLLQELSLFCDD